MCEAQTGHFYVINHHTKFTITLIFYTRSFYVKNMPKLCNICPHKKVMPEKCLVCGNESDDVSGREAENTVLIKFVA